jgi:hypothetical protein
MNYVDLIIKKFGGTRRMAAVLNKPPSTVNSWRARATIPDVEKPHVLSVGLSMGLDLSESSFFPITHGEPPTDEAAA